MTLGRCLLSIFCSRGTPPRKRTVPRRAGLKALAPCLSLAHTLTLSLSLALSVSLSLSHTHTVSLSRSRLHISSPDVRATLSTVKKGATGHPPVPTLPETKSNQLFRVSKCTVLCQRVSYSHCSESASLLRSSVSVSLPQPGVCQQVH